MIPRTNFCMSLTADSKTDSDCRREDRDPSSAAGPICKLVQYNKAYNIVKHEKHCKYGEIQEILA